MDILLATEKQYVSNQRNDRSRLSRNPRSRDEDCDRQYGEEELVQPGDDGPAFGSDDPSRQGREPVGGSALRRWGRLHGRSRHAEVLRARVMNSEDMKEGIQSFIERRAAVFKGR